MSLPTFGFETTAEEVATAFADRIEGKNVLVTGTSLNGIGYGAALAIAKHANLVIITGYNTERLQRSEDVIKKEYPSARVRRLTLDLSSLDAVRKAAAEVIEYPEPIHVLINNAAAATGASLELSADKLDIQFATDHVGPFLFTNLIMPRILAAKTDSYTPRVVYVSSEAHAYGKGINFDNIENPDPANFSPMGAYQEAKTANILSAAELSTRLKGHVKGYSLHPGLILTNFALKPQSVIEMKAIGVYDADGNPNTTDFKWKTIPQGAATLVTAAFDPRLEDKPGAYLVDSNDAPEQRATHTNDPAIAAKLWEISEKIVGQAFSY